MKLSSQQCRAWSDNISVQLGPTLDWLHSLSENALSFVKWNPPATFRQTDYWTMSNMPWVHIQKIFTKWKKHVQHSSSDKSLKYSNDHLKVKYSNNDAMCESTRSYTYTNYKHNVHYFVFRKFTYIFWKI